MKQSIAFARQMLADLKHAANDPSYTSDEHRMAAREAGKLQRFLAIQGRFVAKAEDPQDAARRRVGSFARRARSEPGPEVLSAPWLVTKDPEKAPDEKLPPVQFDPAKHGNYIGYRG